MTKRKAHGLFVGDADIKQRVGDALPAVLAQLDANLDTQHKATMPAGKRSRLEVEKWLEANGFHSANMGEFGKE